MSNQIKFEAYCDEINAVLHNAIKQEDCLYGKIFDAMKYSLDAGGKRIRPVLLLEFARIFGVSVNDAMPFAVALEMIHTYSLIHDDLPCMDDDDLRRGKPTNHKVFGEAVAVLAGDALLNRAFEHVLDNANDLDSGIVLKALRCLASASGADGMIGGQVIDMEGEHRSLNVSEIEQLQDMKTGALIKAAAKIGCILGQASVAHISFAEDYASNVGLAFQIKDDILNVEGDAGVIGKDVGNDEVSGKATFVKLLGLDACKKRLEELTEKAVLSAKKLPDGEFLAWLAYMLLTRDK